MACSEKHLLVPLVLKITISLKISTNYFCSVSRVFTVTGFSSHNLSVSGLIKPKELLKKEFWFIRPKYFGSIDITEDEIPALEASLEQFLGQWI